MEIFPLHVYPCYHLFVCELHMDVTWVFIWLLLASEIKPNAVVPVWWREPTEFQVLRHSRPVLFIVIALDLKCSECCTILRKIDWLIVLILTHFILTYFHHLGVCQWVYLSTRSVVFRLFEVHLDTRWNRRTAEKNLNMGRRSERRSALHRKKRKRL